MYVALIVLAAVVLALLLLFVALAGYGRLAVRNQRRTLEALRRNGLAFLCRPTLGMQHLAGFVLSVDHDTVSLWKVGLRPPVRQRAFPARGARVTPTTVRVNVARRTPGLSVLSAACDRLDVVIYPDPTMAYSRPADPASLSAITDQLHRALSTPR